ncbi:MAG: glycosyltransferase family 2 protein [Chloroflexota bacterium]
MKPGLASIMMPAYNAEQYIERAIASIFAQSYTHWELIVIDDGSTDRTANVVEGFDDARIRLIRHENKGEAGARNTALEHVHGEFLAFLDADDAYLPHHLEVTVGYLQAHPDCGGVYTDGYYCDETGTRMQTLSSRRRGPFEGRVFEQAVRASDLFGPPVCVVLRRELIEQHNLRFDEDIVIGPDWDFLTRYADLATFGYVSQPTCLYRVHRDNITNRTGSRKRALDMARCRAKAIKMEGFRSCSVGTRTAVFYDLLVNLLRGLPERQSEVVEWSEFRELPREAQARLLRLMASKSIIEGVEDTCVKDWLRQSRRLNASDTRCALLSAVYAISPSLCKTLLRLRTRRQVDPLSVPPLADLKLGKTLS